jgi:hypothetical protein
MTIEQTIKDRLIANGLFEDQAAEVMAILKKGEGRPMERRWAEDVKTYPPSVIAILWIAAKTTALHYLEEHMPNAWFLPMFEG